MSTAARPGPEEKRLAYFVGTWKYRLEMKASPFGPAGVVTGSDANELLPGGFFLVRRYRTKTPDGDLEGIEVIGWDAGAQAYIQRGFDSRGQSHLHRGSVRGQTWTFTCDAAAGGKTYKARILIKEVSPTLSTYRSEVSDDGEAWETVLDGTLEKAK